MASSVIPVGWELKDHLTLGLHKVMSEENGKVLRQVLLWGTPRRKKDQKFEDYLTEVKKISGVHFRKGFNRSQRDKMDKDSDIGTYDVSMLYQCIQYGCDDLADPKDDKWVEHEDTLERKLTWIKTHRNDFMHEEYVINEKSYIDKIEEIRLILNDTIQKAGFLYKADETEVNRFLEKINDTLSCIRDRPFDALASMVLYESLSIILKVEGRRELEKRYRNKSSISPLSNLTGKSITIDIQTIFTKMEIYTERRKRRVLELDELFNFADVHSSRKTVILVEGVAGAGKTTFTRKILNDWALGSTTIKNLTDYDMTIWTECRDGRTCSLTQLLHSSMPGVTKRIQNDQQLIKCFQEKNSLLFIIDGLDEINAASEGVLNDIMGLEDCEYITVLCTTRPNKVKDIRRYVPDTFNILHVKISGILESDRAEFVMNYSRALASDLGSTDTSGLLQYLKSKESRLQEHLRLPFNLVLLTLLWFLEPGAVDKMTTATELFVKTYELCQKRLIQRLHDNIQTKHLSSDEMNERVNLYVKQMAKRAFFCHYNDETNLAEASLKKLRDTCESQKLPSEEVLGSFLVQTTSLIDLSQQKFSFPHKGLQDFFCALHVEMALVAEEKKLNVDRILDSFEFILLKENVPWHKIASVMQVSRSELVKEERSHVSVRDVLLETFEDVALDKGEEVEADLTKWQNATSHLIGLLHHRGRPMSDARAAELVALLQESGIRSSEEWFDFLSNVKSDICFTKHIKLSGHIVVADGQVDAFMSVIKRSHPTVVVMNIHSDPRELPQLPNLLQALAEKSCEVQLYLDHDFRFPKEGGSVLDRTLCKMFGRSNVKVTGFTGQLSASAAAALPPFESWPRLSVTNVAHLRSLRPFLASYERRRRKMRLALHLPLDSTVDVALLQPLPCKGDVDLYLSNVEEATVEKARRILGALRPSGRYFRLLFPGALEREGNGVLLLEALGRQRLNVEFGVFASPRIPEGEEQQLKDLARRTLGCGFQVASDDEIWRMT